MPRREVTSALRSTVILLLGPYGVGKRTIAESLCDAAGTVLFDNHLTSNVILQLVGADGTTPLSDAVWDYAEEIRKLATEAAIALGPTEVSYVLTGALLSRPRDVREFSRAEEMARRRQSNFVPVVLSCEERELALRIPRPDRAANHKHTDVASALSLFRREALLPVTHANLLRLDVTLMRPETAANEILEHIARLKRVHPNNRKRHHKPAGADGCA